jgi:hypothetical protein
MEPLATMASSTATVAPYLGLLTATVAKIVGALNTNISSSGSVYICLGYGSSTGYVPRLHMALSAVRSERRVDSRTRVSGPPDFVEALYAWQKLNSIGSTNFRGANRHQRGTAVWCKSEDRCGAFCGFNHSNAKSSSTSTHVPELNIRGRTRG